VVGEIIKTHRDLLLFLAWNSTTCAAKVFVLQVEEESKSPNVLQPAYNIFLFLNRIDNVCDIWNIFHRTNY
jgi:hypothetical protein